MIRTTRGAAAVLGTLTMAAALAASAGTAAHAAAASIPVISNADGTAGYVGADDNHTHYRDVRTTVIATPGVADLNGTTAPGVAGADLCDPNTGHTLGIGLWDDGGTFAVSYLASVSTLTGPAADPCISDLLAEPLTSAPQLVGPAAHTSVGIAEGDSVYLEAFYGPWGRHAHAIGYAVCDQTQGWCRQYSSVTSAPEYFWEFGVGAYSGMPVLTGGAVNLVTSYTGADQTCYSCRGPSPIGQVDGWQGNGGLRAVQWVNGAAQPEMAPGPLAGNAFNLYEGSVTP